MTVNFWLVICRTYIDARDVRPSHCRVSTTHRGAWPQRTGSVQFDRSHSLIGSFSSVARKLTVSAMTVQQARPAI
eukprot:COSAG01_NODE_535_length_15804_cov_33.841452_12_plen_75_part_00